MTLLVAAPAASAMVWVSAALFGMAGLTWPAILMIVVVRHVDPVRAASTTGTVLGAFYLGLLLGPLGGGAARPRHGTIVGEMSFLLDNPTTATVMADTDVTVEVLTTELLARMEREAPQLSAALHRRLAEIVSERLATANRTIAAAFD